jgi:hypothetical protein
MAPPLGAFYIEDVRGVRLVDLRAESDFAVEFLLPASTLFLRTVDREAEFVLTPGETITFDRLALRPLSERARGAIDSSLRKGLFATRFGPSYYSGFTDRPEALATAGLTAFSVKDDQRLSVTPQRTRVSPWLFGASASLTVAAGIFEGSALVARADFNRTDLQLQAQAARDRYDRARILAFSLAGAAVVTVGVAVWLWLAGR